METVRCRDCGFLALLDQDTAAYISPPQPYRRAQRRAWSKRDDPFCARNFADLPNDMDEMLEVGAHTRDEVLGAVLGGPRVCPKYYEWVPGLSIADHQGLWMDKYLERLAEERREADRKFQTDQQKWDQEFQRKLATDNRKGLLFNAIIAAVIAALVAFGASQAFPPEPAPLSAPSPPAVQSPSAPQG